MITSLKSFRFIAVILTISTCLLSLPSLAMKRKGEDDDHRAEKRAKTEAYKCRDVVGIQNLPEDILQEILQNFSTDEMIFIIAKVNKKFNKTALAITQHKLTNVKIDKIHRNRNYYRFSSHETKDELGKIITEEMFQHVKLTREISEEEFLHFGSQILRLSKNVHINALSSEEIQALFKSMSSDVLVNSLVLQNIRSNSVSRRQNLLAGCQQDESPIKTSSFQSWPLQHLEISVSFVLELDAQLPNLLTLSLYDGRMLDINSIDNLPNSLKEILIDGSLIDDDALIKLAKQCPHLQKLSLFNCRSISAKGFESIALPSLKTLHIKNIDTSNFTSDTFSKERFNDLENISISVTEKERINEGYSQELKNRGINVVEEIFKNATIRLLFANK